MGLGHSPEKEFWIPVPAPTGWVLGNNEISKEENHSEKLEYCHFTHLESASLNYIKL